MILSDLGVHRAGESRTMGLWRDGGSLRTRRLSLSWAGVMVRSVTSVTCVTVVICVLGMCGVVALRFRVCHGAYF